MTAHWKKTFLFTFLPVTLEMAEHGKAIPVAWITWEYSMYVQHVADLFQILMMTNDHDLTIERPKLVFGEKNELQMANRQIA